MADAVIDIEFRRDVLDAVKQLRDQMEGLQKTVGGIEGKTKTAFDGIKSSLRQLSLTNITQQFQNLSQCLSDLSAPGMAFNASLKDLSALTGLTGNDLDGLAKKARESAKEFGGQASESVETYKTILGRLGPDIAKSGEALSGMERNVQILSKTMGGDAAGAVDALTTAMLQFGVDLSDPMKAQEEMSKMMDIMANAAKEGAAEVPSISAALKVAGVASKQANVSFEETNAAIQALAAGGKEGAEAGTALRNVLGKMAGEDVIPKEAAGKLRKLGVDMRVVSDTSLPFTTRLRELKKAQGDATIMAQVFGVENAAAANILLDSVDAQDDLTQKILDGAGAMSMASKIMESDEEKQKRLKAAIDDVKLSFYDATGGLTAYLGPVSELTVTLSSFIPLVDGVARGVMWLGKTKLAAAIGSKLLAAAQLSLSAITGGVMKVVQAMGRAFVWLKNTQLVTAISTRVVAAAQVIWQLAVEGVSKAFLLLRESQVVGAVATKVITAAQWLWNAAMAANPIGLVIAGVLALTAVVYALTKAFSFSSDAARLNGEVAQRVTEKTADQRAELDRLFTTLKTAKKGSDEYNNTLKELDKIQPGIVEKYNLQKGALNDINAAQKEMIKNIDMIAKAEAWKEVATEKYKDAFKQQAEGPSGWDYARSAFGGPNAAMLNNMDIAQAKRDAHYATTELVKLKNSKGYKAAVSAMPGAETDANGMADWMKLAEDTDPTKAGTQTTTPKSLVSPSGDSDKKYSGKGEMKNINIRIENLVRDITIQTTNVGESMQQIKDMVTEALVGAVRDVEVAL